MIDGLKVTVPAEPARELGERVWDWASRNLFWLLREDPAALDWLDLNLPGLAERATPLTPRGRLFARKGMEHADEVTARRAGRWLTLSALNLRPGLDELLGRYGARLDAQTPSLSEALATCADEDAPLVAQLETRPPLLLVPNDPGKPSSPTRFVCVFQINEWPLTAKMEGIFGVDARLRDCVSWICPSGAGTPSIFAAIPEVEFAGADTIGMFALLSHCTPLIWQKPLSWLGNAPNMKRAFHASATRSEVEGFFTAEGFRLLTVTEVLAMHRVWSSIQHARLARVGHDPEPWAYPELWTEVFPPRGSAPERRRFRALARADQGIFRRASFSRPFDGFAIVRDALMEAGMKRPEVFASMVAVLPSWMHAGSWIWHLVGAIREEPAVRKALSKAGFTRCHIVHLRQLLAAELHERSISVPPLVMDCAEIETPEGLEPGTAAVVRRGFPILGQRYAIHLHQCTLTGGGLGGDLFLVRRNDEEQITGLGGRQSTLLTAEQLRSTGAAEALQARMQALGELSRAEFDALFDDGQEDPFQPFLPTSSAALAALVGEFLPVTLVDGSELDLRRLQETAKGLWATVTVTTRNEKGECVSVQERGECRILGVKELKGKAARSSFERKVAQWKRTSVTEIWELF
jgi:hypothetical protein